ncbi:MAG: hypothetical protein OXI66_03570 [Boseongicola sp.]|nr:hypothetical protein [Boseongicola sp.]MDE0344851.1 hypothetical protein [Boseongicola sp.]MXW85235.1 hypothetical protein [Boseongicola sp. SB0667_bin_21]
MSGNEFIAVTAVILFMAFLVGWFTRWLVTRLTQSTLSDMSEVDTLAEALHQAELERDNVQELLRRREEEHKNELNQVLAELSTAMDGLRDSRRESEELRAHVERAGDQS